MAAPILSTLVMMGTALHGAPVDFADPSLKAAVEAALGVPDPTPEHMSGLTSLDASRQGITDLTGLEYATNLQTLRVYDNPISDLGPLAGLIQLQDLDVGQNQISDFSVLSGLSDLRILNIHGNPTGDLTVLSSLSNLEHLTAYEMQISDLSPLSVLGNLCYLDLFENQVSDLSPLASLSSLRTLYVGANRVSDLSALAGLTDLDTLSATCNQISDISGLSGLANLRSLNLFANQISDISALAGLTSLRSLDLSSNPLGAKACALIPEIQANNPGVSIRYDPCVLVRSLVISCMAGGTVVDPGEGTFPCEDGEMVRLEARADPTFVFVGWSGSLVSGQNPVSLTMDQDHDVRAHFVSLLDTLYVDDDAPADPRPGDRTVGDSRESGTSDHPFDSIQEAVDVAREGARVLVRPGTYGENIDLLGKGILMMGADPNDRSGNPYPTIAGEGGGPVLRFTQGEGPTCTVTGFTITGATGQPNETILCVGSSPTLGQCLIVGNRVTTQKGAIVRCANSQAAFTNCTIADNHAGGQGAAFSLTNSPVTLTSSIVWGNGPKEILLNDTVRPTLHYTDITGGWEGPGNRAADPLFTRPGHWADPGDPDVVWQAADPQAVWIEGDYHLRSQVGRWDPQTRTWVQDPVSSPCIDAGDLARSVGYEPAPHGGIINMGAYGGTAQASQSILDLIQ